MGKFSGKTMLILGTSTGAIDLILHARSHGARVLVADYYNQDKSPAKSYADESRFSSAPPTLMRLSASLTTTLSTACTRALANST